MKSLRPWAALGGTTVLALGLSACVDTEVEVEAIDAVSYDGEELRFAHVYDPDHPVEICGVPAVNEELEDVGVRINSYPSGQLGDEQELLEQVQAGSLEMAIAGPSFLGVWEENAELFDAAYLFTDADHMEATVNGEIAEEIFAELREGYGLDVLSTWYYGTRHATADVAVHTSDDLSGHAFRVPEAPLYQALADVLGASATSMALGEVYLGLQQGTIDAQENPIPTIASYNFYDVQNYLNLTHHMVQGVMVTGSEAALSVLDEDQRQALDEALQVGAAATRECVEEQEESYIDEWQESGVIEVNDDVDLDHFRDRAAEIIPERFAWGDLYLEIQQAGDGDD
ncbi:DctP family TRAP transporter solute-binding subunit [Nesterenkonia alba]|uniref:DctP family TRAP transporter solute-binding subunit n=1 Tax=Nesterenkonia alba TaxID=515814 RepID=UPI0003B7B019|nr:DctP family TRAP transporter solute-binding subunit [Nesterenkonia alba]